jgi:hypothetical protein
MTGYKYRPWMYVMVVETFSIQTGFTPNLESFVVSSSSSRGFIDPSTSVSTGNLVSCLVSCDGFRS